MMKRVLGTIIMLLISITFLYSTQHRDEFTGFQCSGMMVYRSTQPEGAFTYTIEARMFFTGKRTGFYAINGTLSQKNQHYNLHRTRFFTYEPRNKQGLNEITITREIISTLDNVPGTLNNPLLVPVGQSLLPRFKRIDNDAILVSVLYSPFFICAKH